MLAGGCPLSCDRSLCTGTRNSRAILFRQTFSRVSIAAMAWVTRSSTSAKVSGIVVGCGGDPKLVGQFFEILGYMGDAGYMGSSCCFLKTSFFR